MSAAVRLWLRPAWALAFLLAPALAAGVNPSGEASETAIVYTPPESGLRIQVFMPASEVPMGGGYLPLIVRVENASGRDARYTLTTEAVLGYGDGQSGTRASEHVFTAPDGQRTFSTITVPLPAGMDAPSRSFSGSDVVFIEGRLRGPALAPGGSTFAFSNSSGGGASFSHPYASVALYRALYPRKNYKDELGRRGTPAQVIRLGLLAEDWRTYLAFTHVLLTRGEWEGLRPAQRAAILDWVSLGGELRLLSAPGTGTLPAGLPNRAQPSDNKLALGRGHVRLFQGSEAEAWSGFLNSPAPGNGNFFAIEEPGERHHGPLPTAIEHENRPNELFVDLPRLTRSTALVMGIAVLFGVAVGPVNFFVLAKGNRRHRVVYYTPAFSLGTTALIALAILVGDGTGGDGRRATLAFVIPERNQMALLREEASQSGLLLTDSFDYSATAALFPVVHNEGQRREIMPFNIHNLMNEDSRQGARFAVAGNSRRGDWYSSRALQSHFIVDFHPTRAGMRLDPSAPQPRLTSTINALCPRVFLVGGDGRVWTAENVGPGKAVSLRASSRRDFDAFIDKQASGMGTLLRAMLFEAARQPGDRFFATVEGLEAFEQTTHESFEWTDTRSVLVGPLEAAP